VGLWESEDEAAVGVFIESWLDLVARKKAGKVPLGTEAVVQEASPTKHELWVCNTGTSNALVSL
jgi:hypothetical protein